MRSYTHNRIVAPLGRLPWYRRTDWRVVTAILIPVVATVLIILWAAKGVKS